MVGTSGSTGLRLAPPVPERPELSGFDMRRRLNERAEHDLGVAAEHIDHGRSAAAERHVHDIDAGHELEQFAAEMLETADAGRC